jgi:hypothetical protein
MDSQSPFALLLVGQPTLARQLRLGVFAALDQRIATRYQLAPMDLAEAAQYLRHHLALAKKLGEWFRWIWPVSDQEAAPHNPATRENRAFKAFLLVMMGLVAVAAGILIALLLSVPSPSAGPPQPTPTPVPASATPVPSPLASATIASASGNRVLMLAPIGRPTPRPVLAALAQPAETSTPTPTPTVSGGGAAPPGSLPNPPPPGSFGVFDLTSSANLSAFTKFLVAIIVLIAAAIIEMLLMTLYAAFFVNDPMNAQLSLGLPPATVRVVLVGLIVLVILVFSLLPEVWGGNRAVVLLFGLLSTVIGFYFGSRSAADSQTGGVTPVRFTLGGATTTQTFGQARPVSGTLDANFQSTLGSGQINIVAILLKSSGLPLPDSRAMAVVDRNGKVEFDFSKVIGRLPAVPIPAPAPEAGSYILRVQSPSIVQCDERITLNEPAGG